MKKKLSNSKDEVMPNFLIVGASKSGTTSLYYWLKKHPDVFLPNLKEPFYFVDDYQFTISKWDDYLKLFRGGRGKRAIGEASASYLFHPVSSKWIRRTLGDIKIIIVLRNPVDRCFSLYRFYLMLGCENIPTFERALIAEKKRQNSKLFRKVCLGYYRNYSYFNTGLYFDQVRRYLSEFSQVKIYLFDDLREKPQEVFHDMCKFLDIDSKFLPDFSVHNVSRLPRFIMAQCVLRLGYNLYMKYFGSCGVIANIPKPLIPLYKVIRLGMELNCQMGHKSVLFPPKLRKSLIDAYSEDINNLSRLINRDLSIWQDHFII